MALKSPLEAFLATHIDSVETLEILLLLARGKALWPTESIAETLGLEADVTAERIEALVASGLVARVGTGCRFSPGREETRELVAELAREYSEHRANVINVIYSANLERLRRFADAFRLRKK